jgi:hypothetical protein
MTITERTRTTGFWVLGVSVFSEEDTQTLIRMLNNVWQAVAGDLFQCIKMDNPNRTFITKAEVVEIVMDANRIKMYGQDRFATSKDTGHQKNLIKRFRNMETDDQIRFCRDKAFTWETYV